METVLEILKYTLPAIVVLITAYLLVNAALNHITTKLELERRLVLQKDTLPLRLQAYERLAIFLERNQISNLALRLAHSDYSLIEFQNLLIETVRTEYEHNLSQQLYVSTKSWMAVRFVKDDAIRMVNIIAGSMPPDASSLALAKKLIEITGQGEGPGDKALELLHQEVQAILK